MIVPYCSGSNTTKHNLTSSTSAAIRSQMRAPSVIRTPDDFYHSSKAELEAENPPLVSDFRHKNKESIA
jgi:hypothetical protein